jgi:putative tricarboxylic transport membrane protein
VGKPMIVTNKPGANGRNMEIYMGTKKPDGYNLLITTATTILWKYSQASGVDLLNDFRPIVRLQVEPNFIGVAANSPYKTFQDLLAAAKEGKVKFGGGPVGGPEYLFYYNLCHDKGFKFSWVAYGGGGEASVALLGGDIGTALLQASESIDYIKAGKIRYLGVASAKRYTDIPEFAQIPTVKEHGYDFVFEHWRGVHALGATPDYAVKFLAERFRQASEADGWKKWLKDSGQIGGYLGPEDFGKFIADQDALIKAVVTKANLLKMKQK